MLLSVDVLIRTFCVFVSCVCAFSFICCVISHQMPLLLIFPLMGSADGTVYDSLTMTNDNDDDPETVSLIFKV